MRWNGDWHMGGMGLWWILIIAAVCLVLLFAARRGRGGQESPEQMLKRRYAEGKIDRETYERMLALVDDTDVAPVADEAKLRLCRVFDAIASVPESRQMHAPPKEKR